MEKEHRSMTKDSAYEEDKVTGFLSCSPSHKNKIDVPLLQAQLMISDPKPLQLIEQLPQLASLSHLTICMEITSHSPTK